MLHGGIRWLLRRYMQLHHKRRQPMSDHLHKYSGLLLERPRRWYWHERQRQTWLAIGILLVIAAACWIETR